VTRQCQLDGEVAADRTGAENTELHLLWPELQLNT
jgi:hypothetical protein